MTPGTLIAQIIRERPAPIAGSLEHFSNESQPGLGLEWVLVRAKNTGSRGEIALGQEREPRRIGCGGARVLSEAGFTILLQA